MKMRCDRIAALGKLLATAGLMGLSSIAAALAQSSAAPTGGAGGKSETEIAKQTVGTTPDGLPVHSFQSLLADLATIARNTVVTALDPDHEFTLHTRPTTIQQKALQLLDIKSIDRTQ